MADNTAFIQISDGDGSIFPHCCNNDFLIYTTAPAKVIIGTSNTPSCMTFDATNSNTTIPTSLTLQGDLQFNNYMAMRGLRIDRTIDPQNPKNVTNTYITGFNNTPAGVSVFTPCNLITMSPSNQEVVRMYANPARVGINTADPSCTLDVNGGFRVVGGPVVFPSGSISTGALNGVLSQWTTGAALDKISITGSNVGIGTVSPGQLLEVASTGANNAFALLNANGSTGQAGLKVLAGGGAANAASRIDFLNGVASTTVPRWTLINDYLQNGTNGFDFVNGAGARVVSILQSGNVGIGVTAPAQSLEVAGNTSCSGTVAWSNMAFMRNRVINGDFRYDSTNAGAAVNIPIPQTKAIADRWTYGNNLQSGMVSGQQSNLASPIVGTSLTTCVKATTTAASVAVIAGYYSFFYTTMDRALLQDLAWGTASAAPASLSFWVNTSVVGNYGVCIRDAVRTFVVNFAVGSANTWQRVNISIPGDTSGTWTTTVDLFVFTANGATHQTSSTGVWMNRAPSYFLTGTGITNTFPTTLNATFMLAGVQFEKGSVVTPSEFLPAPVQQLMTYGYASPSSMGLFRNRIINGDMKIALRGTSATITANYQPACCDKYSFEFTAATGSLTTTQQVLASTDAPFQAAGCTNSMRITSTGCTGITYIGPSHYIDGMNMADIGLATNACKPFTISHWFKSNVTGTFSTSVRVLVSPLNSYISTFTYPTAEVWQYVQTTIPPLTGISTSTEVSIQVVVGAYANAANAVGAWQTNLYGTSLVTNWAQTNGNYIEFTALQLEKGTLQTPFERRIPLVESLLNQNLVLGSVANNTVGNVSAGNLGMFRNRVINGDMRIDQRNAGAVKTVASGTNWYATHTIDRFMLNSYNLSIPVTMQQVDTPGLLLADIRKCVKISTGATAAGLRSEAYCTFLTSVEMCNMADLRFGTSDARSTTLSFFINISTAGTYGVFIGQEEAGPGHAPTGRQRLQTFTVTTANAWQYVSMTIPGDVQGGWGSVAMNALGFRVGIALGGANAGPYFGSTGAWVSRAGGYPMYTFSGLNTVWMTTADSTCFIAGMQLEKGSVATPFEFRPYAMELQLCQRYFYCIGYPMDPASTVVVGLGAANTTTTVEVHRNLPVSMRTAPLSITMNGVAGWNCGGAGANISSITLNGSGANHDPTTLVLVVTLSTTVTAQSCHIFYKSTAEAYLWVNAEL